MVFNIEFFSNGAIANQSEKVELSQIQQQRTPDFCFQLKLILKLRIREFYPFRLGYETVFAG